MSLGFFEVSVTGVQFSMLTGQMFENLGFFIPKFSIIHYR